MVRFKAEADSSFHSLAMISKQTMMRCLDEATGRVDVDDVAESLMLSKPSDADDP